MESLLSYFHCLACNVLCWQQTLGASSSSHTGQNPTLSTNRQPRSVSPSRPVIQQRSGSPANPKSISTPVNHGGAPRIAVPNHEQQRSATPSRQTNSKTPSKTPQQRSDTPSRNGDHKNESATSLRAAQLAKEQQHKQRMFTCICLLLRCVLIRQIFVSEILIAQH
jgi:hypothetical protein